MALKPVASLVAAAAVCLQTVLPLQSAWAGPAGGGGGGGPHCPPPGHGGGVVIINKPITITKSVSIWKPVTINKDVNIWNNVDIQKNVTINKNVNIQKSVVINKSDSSSAVAEAFAFAGARAEASAGGNVYYGSYSEENVTYNYRGGEVAAAAEGSEEQACTMQEASVIKAIHAVCLAPDGHEFPASHMQPETFIESSYEGEIARCIPGARLKLVIGDVLQSDQGMAGTYQSGDVLYCAEHEAVRHYKDGMLKCERAVPVPDCTERTNLRKYGTGDMFFTFRRTVCAMPARTARQQTHSVEVSGMSMEGGVGAGR
jgi:hypothetical protein